MALFKKKEPADSKGSAGEEKKKPKDADNGYQKIRLGACKDILTAESPQALDAALLDYVRACIQEEDEG